MVGINKDKLSVIVPVALIILAGILVVNIDRIFPTPSASEKIGEIMESANFSSSRSYGTNPNASVTVVEFSDFQCPACAMAAPELEKVRKYYGSRINVIYKHFPVKTGSQKAAEAAECARDQGKFWEYHDILFENLHEVGAASLERYAGSLGLDTSRFMLCLSSGEKAAKVKADFADGRGSGVQGTPTFFVNKMMMVGAQPFEDFKAVIDEELAKG